jgi:hypothetical protein
VNGTKIGGAGTISDQGLILKKNSLPDVYPVPVELLREKGFNVIALRVGDDVGWGGPETADFYIGRADILQLKFNQFVVWNSAVFIILALLGLYFLILYLGWGRDAPHLFFALLSLSISLMLFGYYSFPYWVINSFWFTHFLFHTGIQIAAVLGIHFLYAFFDFPQDRILKIFTTVGVLLLLILLLTPLHHSILRFYGNVSFPFALMFNAVSFVYILGLVLKAIRQKKPGARLIGVGCAIALICFLNDILGFLIALDSRRLGAEGTLVLMVSVSMAMFMKQSHIGSTLRASSSALVSSLSD